MAFFLQIKLETFGRQNSMRKFIHYWVAISPQKIMLWCYLIWWGFTVVNHFDPSIKLWTNSLGISVVIGTALVFSVSAATKDSWQVFRLYWMPFAVSSFAALIKGQGYWVIFSPHAQENLQAALACLIFVVSVWAIKSAHKAAAEKKSAITSPDTVGHHRPLG